MFILLVQERGAGNRLTRRPEYATHADAVKAATELLETSAATEFVDICVERSRVERTSNIIITDR